MLRSMFAAVTGLRAHQAFMDVVGNNIANVNTTGYKSSSVLFEDLLSQQLTGAGAPTAVQGGTNPAQVGLGVRLTGVIDQLRARRNPVDRSLDRLRDPRRRFLRRRPGRHRPRYTRNGSFSLDANGNLVTADGDVRAGLAGRPERQRAARTTSVGHLKIPVGQIINPVTTQHVTIGGNLPSDAATGTTVDAAINVYNSTRNHSPAARRVHEESPTPPAKSNWSVKVFDSDNNALIPATAR